MLNNKINLIGSFNVLQRGKTLEGVENCILVSYYSKEHLFDQKLGRIIRFVENKTANMYIFCLPNSLQEKWYNIMLENVEVEINEPLYYKTL